MQIIYNQKRVKEFSQMLLAHPFEEYRGFTSAYRAFEDPDLKTEMKEQFLHKLSVANPLAIPSFAQFWSWVRKNHGMKLVAQMCEFLYPKDDPEFQKTLNRVRASKTHAFWKHIKARVYKKWCSIVTEAQCVYATLRGIEKYGLNWRVLANAQLDGVGIDFVIITEDKAIPIQIKKDTFSRYASNKKNSMDNFGQFNLSKKAQLVLKKNLLDVGFTKAPEQAMILKYALLSNNQLPYAYLGQFENGFVYFKSDALICQFRELFETKVEIAQPVLHLVAA